MTKTVAIVGCFLGLLVLMPSSSALAGRWYGSLSLSAQKTRQSPSPTPNSGQYMSQALINVEDVLFYKNRLRLAGNFDWRDDMYTAFHEYRPIYYADLYGYGYALNTSFSPYTRMGAVAGDTTDSRTIDIVNRDFRAAFATSYPKFPTLNIVYNRYRQYDNEPVKAYNSLQRTWVIETGFRRQSYSLRANYNRTKRVNYLENRNGDVVRSVSGTISGLTPVSRYGNLGATYNYYDTKRSIPGAVADLSHTHSVTLMAGTSYIKKTGVAASYSGRFTGATNRFNSEINSRSETMSGSFTYSPTGYLELQAVKAYQLDGREKAYEISEYVTLSASLTRYIRRGVDTRLAYTRSMYQQSNRTIQFVDSLGNLDSSRRIGDFKIDTWYGSISFSPVAYVKTNAAYSITRDSDPISEDQTFQSTGTADARLAVSQQIEARLAYTSNYQGKKLRFGHAFSESWNLGATWIPRSNLNLVVTYTHAAYNTTVRNSSGNVNVYMSYAFRRAFSFYVSYGQQQQTQAITSAGSGTQTTTSRPESWNTQLIIYTGKHSTLTLGYLKSSSNLNSASAKRISETYQAVYNFRI